MESRKQNKIRFSAPGPAPMSCLLLPQSGSLSPLKWEREEEQGIPPPDGQTNRMPRTEGHLLIPGRRGRARGRKLGSESKTERSEHSQRGQGGR